MLSQFPLGFITICLFCWHSDSQQITINPILIPLPEIVESYDIVHGILYQRQKVNKFARRCAPNFYVQRALGGELNMTAWEMSKPAEESHLSQHNQTLPNISNKDTQQTISKQNRSVNVSATDSSNFTSWMALNPSFPHGFVEQVEETKFAYTQLPQTTSISSEHQEQIIDVDLSKQAPHLEISSNPGNSQSGVEQVLVQNKEDILLMSFVVAVSLAVFLLVKKKRTIPQLHQSMGLQLEHEQVGISKETQEDLVGEEYPSAERANKRHSDNEDNVFQQNITNA